MIQKKVLNKLGGFALAASLPVGLFLIACLAFDNIRLSSFPLLLRQCIGPCIIAWGVCFEFKAGNWDFSLGAVAALAAILGGNLSIQFFGDNLLALFLMCTSMGFLMGLLSSTIYRICRIPTILVTIGMIFIYESLTTLLYRGKGVYIPDSMVILGDQPYNIIVFIVLFAASFLLYNFSKVSYGIRAVGKNADVAFFNGIDVYKMKRLAMLIAATFAGIYGFYLLGYEGVQRSVSGMVSMATVFGAMMCVFLAFALEKIVNVVVGICFGAFTLQVIKLMLLAMGFPNQYNNAVIAALVLVLMVIDSGKLKALGIYIKKTVLKTSRKEETAGD